MAFALTMLSFLLFVNFAGKKGGAPSPVLILLALSFVFFAIAFLLIEIYLAANPMIPFSMLKQDRLGFYFAVQVLLLVAQFTVSFRSQSGSY